jgi:hypothetical protein
MSSDKDGKLKYEVIIPPGNYRLGKTLYIYINPGESIYDAVCDEIYDEDNPRPDVIQFKLKLRRSPRLIEGEKNTLILLDEMAPYSDDEERFIIDFHWLE